LINNTSKVGIFGTSGMAKEVGNIARDLKLQPVYVAISEQDAESFDSDEIIILEKHIFKYLDIPYVVGIANGTVCKLIHDRYRGKLNFTNLIHPNVTFGYKQQSKIEEAEGVIIAAGSRFTCGITVGDFCIFNQNVTIAHDCEVGNYVHVAPGVNVSGNVRIGDGSWIGAGAVVNQGSSTKKLNIGKNTIIGSGAVVIKDCKKDSVYVGVPASKVK